MTRPTATAEPVPVAETGTTRSPLWLPMTPMNHFERYGTTIVAGDGVRVTDSTGRTYLSATAGLWNVTCGWNHPRIIEAITRQLQRLSYGTLFRFDHDVARELAARLLSVVPGDHSCVYFSSSGSAAKEAAVKVLRRYRVLIGQPERRLVVSFEASSWHGAGAGEPIDQAAYGADLRWHRHLPFPDTFAAARGLGPDERTCLDALHAMERTDGDRVAAVVVEPILASGGVLVPPPGFLEEVAAACKRMGAHLVVDEVATGLGRTGRMFGIEHTGVVPDVVFLSKGLTSGYLPLAATLFPEEVREAYENRGTFLSHGETQSGNPAACAAALATLDVIEDEGLVQRAATAGARLRGHLDALSTLDVVGEVRGRGLAIGVELVGDPAAGAPLAPGAAAVVTHICQQNGLIVHPGPRGISLFPPLIVTDADIDEIATRLAGVLRAATVRARVT